MAAKGTEFETSLSKPKESKDHTQQSRLANQELLEPPVKNHLET